MAACSRHGKRRREIPNPGAVAREAQASREAVQKGDQSHAIVAMTGLSYPAVRGVIDRFEQGGWSAIRPALRGRNRGDGRVLSPAQEQSIHPSSTVTTHKLLIHKESVTKNCHYTTAS